MTTVRSPHAPVPSRVVLKAAEATNQRLGHENLGFLSEARGFFPIEQPALALPASHRAWDEVAARLPDLFRSLSLRRSLEALPILSASEGALDERSLLRASAILSICAHAYFYAEPDPPGPLPASIQRPWGEVSRRLQRPAPHLSFTDLNLYNWKLVDPVVSEIRVDNIELLIPIMGNEAERRFQMTPVEMVAVFGPIVGAVVRAQEAVTADDDEALTRELVLIINVIDAITFDSFPKVNPNPYSSRYVNPVVWGKTVAPLATPFQTEDPPPGPSGTAIPAFQLLDGFFGRKGYATSVGHETARVRQWFPKHWRDFLDAADVISMPRHIATRGDTALRGIFQQALEAYAGEGGLLGRHRLKTFGFLDLSFKAGRSKTLGGFGGGIEDRLWDRMDVELDLARLERYPAGPENCHFARLARVEALRDGDTAAVAKVVLDVAGNGVRYRPGSRCAVLPENRDDLVEGTLRSLRARGDESVQLNQEWLEAVKLRDGYQNARIISLRTLLTFGRIRPVTRGVAKALLRMSQNERLREIVEARAEDQWELWEMLDLLARTGFRPARLWKAIPGERESICWIVPPESFRMFSISGTSPGGPTEATREIALTVGRLRYDTKETPVSPAGTRLGTGSGFLTTEAAAAADGRRLSVRVVRPPRFDLPADVRKPVVMFAGGTGLSPFPAMIAERARHPEAGSTWLFFGTRTRADIYHESDLVRFAAEGKLELRIAFSSDDVRAGSDTGYDGSRLVLAPGQRGHVEGSMLEDATAQRLWRMILGDGEGGLGASFYVCGRTGFATSVMNAMRSVIARFIGGPDEHRGENARKVLYRLVGEGRYMQEVFTTYTGPQHEQRNSYDASEVALHNEDRLGYWSTIDGRVYDLTVFRHLHHGGDKIIRSYSGMDATDAYRTARHDVNPEVHSMLGMYEIGALRRLDLGSGWSVAISPAGLRLVSLKDIYRSWIKMLFTTVELQNALGQDYGVRREAVTYDEDRSGSLEQSPYKIRLLLQTHHRFVSEYLPALTGQRLDDLWAATSGIGSEHHHVGWMGQQVRAAQSTRDAEAANRYVRQMVDRLGAAAAAATDAEIQWCAAAGGRLEAEDCRFMDEFKQVLVRGVQVFERWEGGVVEWGSSDLIAAAEDLPAVLARYWGRLSAAADPDSSAPRFGGPPTAAD